MRILMRRIGQQYRCGHMGGDSGYIVSISQDMQCNMCLCDFAIQVSDTLVLLCDKASATNVFDVMQALANPRNRADEITIELPC